MFESKLVKDFVRLVHFYEHDPEFRVAVDKALDQHPDSAVAQKLRSVFQRGCDHEI